MSRSDTPANDEHSINLRLSAQRAPLGYVPVSLRSVSVEYRGLAVVCRFIFDGEPTDYDRDLLSCASAEIISDYNELYTIIEEYLALPCTEEMSFLRHIVFERHEA